METTHGTAQPQAKKAALSGLAVVGFVALIIIGILTAIYAASFIPKALSRFATANVYLSNLTQPQDNSLQAVPGGTYPAQTAPTASTTTSITLSPAPTPVTTTATPSTTVQPVYTTPTYQVVPTTPAYYGLADLTVSITDSGYLRNSNTNSFVSSTNVPSGYQGAVRYTITNRGTNTTGSYRVDIRVRTNNGTDNDSVNASSLPPSRSVSGVGVFDANSSGTADIRITVDANDTVDESNENNNDDSVSLRLSGNSSGNHDSYDSNGNYCSYGTYYQNGRYYCDSTSSTTDHDWYDSNGNYCVHGTYYSGSRYYCDTSSNTNHDRYDSNGNYCSYGTYYQNGRYYCENQYTYPNGNDTCQYGGYYGADNRYYCYPTNYHYTRTDSCVNGGYYGSNGTYYCY